jgi:predicted nuclease with RNAse H fold
MVFIGFDPGGIKSFGWAVMNCNENGGRIEINTGVVSNAPDAVAKVSQYTVSNPNAVGIDAPLYWVIKGDRWSDNHIRKRVIAAGGQSGTVSSVNSLRGACLVQGILTARLVITSWPSVLITEAHPKALLRISKEAFEFVEQNIPKGISEHERDAVVSAYSAWAAATSHPSWCNLLSQEHNPFFPGGQEVVYWFPNVNKPNPQIQRTAYSRR